jgi:biotin carboxylase
MEECILDHKSILFISGGKEALPGIEIAKKMGLHVVVSDGDKNAPGFQIADDYIISSTYDVEQTVLKVKKYHNDVRNFDGVICVAADVPHTVAAVAEELDLPGIPKKAADIAIDKMAMKNCFFKNNIPIPQYKSLDNFEDLKKIIKKWSFPLIIKPVDSRGARGVLRITDSVDLRWAWNHSLSNSPTKRVMAEKYLNGPQISTESIMINGKCHTVGFADRNYELLEAYAPFIIENGGDLPSLVLNHQKEDINKIIERGALSMGISNGIIKGDIVINNNQPFIIELAARLSGGYFCTHEIPLSTGVDLISNAIKQSLGEKINIKDLTPISAKHISLRYFFPKEKKVIKKITGRNKLKNFNFVKFYDILIEENSKVPEIISHPSRAGMVIVEGVSRKDSNNKANTAVNSINFEYF